MAEQTQEQTYNLIKLRDNPDFTFELATRGNCVVPINLKALAALTPVPSNQRAPNLMELTQEASVILGQGADPYSKECGLMPVYAGGFHYEVWVAAQVRMRKAQAQSDYDGYVWGWITKDLIRHESGRATKADPKEIIGAWGMVKRKGQSEPFYHEVFADEVSKAKTDGTGKGSWDKMPISMLAKVIRDQTHKFAYADKMGNLNTEDELRAYNTLPPPVCDTPSRDDRRKPVDSKTVENRQEPIEARDVKSVEAQGTEAAAPPAGEANIQQLYEALLAQFEELNKLRKAPKRFTAFVSYHMCGEEDEYKAVEDFNPGMIALLKTKLENEGIAEDI